MSVVFTVKIIKGVSGNVSSSTQFDSKESVPSGIRTRVVGLKAYNISLTAIYFK
jgi:hypothetical protein